MLKQENGKRYRRGFGRIEELTEEEQRILELARKQMTNKELIIRDAGNAASQHPALARELYRLVGA